MIFSSHCYCLQNVLKSITLVVILFKLIIVGQLRPFLWVNCTHFVKSWRLSTVILIYMRYNFLICHILSQFQDGRHWLWKFHMGQKLKHAPISLNQKYQIVCLVITLPKMYSLMHLRCLIFKLHKVIAQRSFQICTGVKI